MKYVIIGGVGGGATVCARLRRIDEQAELVLLERGPYISYANCGLPYYISGEIRERSRLFLQTPNGFGDRFNTDVRVRHSVEQIDRENKTVTVRDLFKDKVYMESYDKLVLSPGALPVRPPIEGVELEGVMYLRDVGDADAIVNKIKSLLTDLHPRAPHVVVVGAGFIGLEMVESLHRLGCALTVVEAAKQVMTPLDYDLARQIQKHVQERKIVLKLQERITGMMRTEPSEAHPSGALSVQLSGGASLPADRVLLSVGVKPDTALARTAGLRIGEAGGIWVNEYMQTSDPDIYAVGDAVEFPHPLTGKPSLALLAGPANRQARICADNVVYGQIKSYKGSIRTAIAKVFDLQVGCAGLSEKVLQDEGIPFRSALVHAASHAGYYPDARNLSVKIHFSPENGRLLGAQVVGEDGADKRLDVLSEAIGTGKPFMI